MIQLAGEAAHGVKSLTLKIACVVVAALVWIQVAATTLLEADVRLPLDIVGLEPAWTVAGSDLPDAVMVRLEVPKLSLMAHEIFGMRLGSVQMDLAGYEPGTATSYLFKPTDVRTEGEVVGFISPLRVSLRVDWQDARRLPVVVPLAGQLPGTRMLAGPIQVVPDSIEVRGPRSLFNGLDSLRTVPVELTAVTSPVARELTVLPPPAPLQAERMTVRVTVPVISIDELVVANVPVVATTDGRRVDTGVSPPVCDVLVRGPADSVKALVPGRLRVTVPVTGLGAGTHQVVGRVDHPEWVTAIKLEPATFMVIVDDGPSEGGPR